MLRRRRRVLLYQNVIHRVGVLLLPVVPFHLDVALPVPVLENVHFVPDVDLALVHHLLVRQVLVIGPHSWLVFLASSHHELLFRLHLVLVFVHELLTGYLLLLLLVVLFSTSLYIYRLLRFLNQSMFFIINFIAVTVGSGLGSSLGLSHVSLEELGLLGLRDCGILPVNQVLVTPFPSFVIIILQ